MIVRWKLTAIIIIATLLLIASLPRNRVEAQQPSPISKAAATSTAADEGLSIPNTTSAINSPTPMSQRIVHYEINARYTPSSHTVAATEVLTYHNLTGQTLDHFPFHLYQNAFQPNATFVRDSKLMGSRDIHYEKWEPKYYGSEEIKSIEVVGQGDLTNNLQFVAPDDGNKDDKTVVDLRLAKPVPAFNVVRLKS